MDWCSSATEPPVAKRRSSAWLRRSLSALRRLSFAKSVAEADLESLTRLSTRKARLYDLTEPELRTRYESEDEQGQR